MTRPPIAMAMNVCCVGPETPNMCLGVPLQVQMVQGPGSALCHDVHCDQSQRQVSTALLDAEPKTGDWLLVHIDVAVRKLAPVEARQITDALQAVAAAAHGMPFEHLLGDLVGHEPQLPDHLQAEIRRESIDV